MATADKGTRFCQRCCRNEIGLLALYGAFAHSLVPNRHSTPTSIFTLSHAGMFPAAAAKVGIKAGLHSHPELCKALAIQVSNEVAWEHAEIRVEPVLAVGSPQDIGSAEILVDGRGGVDGNVGDRGSRGCCRRRGGSRRFRNAMGTDKGLNCGEVLVEGENENSCMEELVSTHEIFLAELGRDGRNIQSKPAFSHHSKG